MANTTNFGWETPDDTDLVKDGAAAIRTLGSAIDTSLVDLKGGTTGQVLSKATNTDLDFTWTTVTADITEVNAGTGISGGGTSGAVTITNSMATAIDAKGDLIAGTGADTFSRLAVGTNGQYLQADSTAATGLKWASISAGGWTLLNSGGTSLSGSSVTISSISGSYKNLHLFIYDDYYTSGGLLIRINGRTSNYAYWGSEQGTGFSSTSATEMLSAYSDGSTTSQKNFTWIEFPDYANTSTVKQAAMTRAFVTGSLQKNLTQTGYYHGSTGKTDAITSITILTGGAFSGGTAYLYGEN